MIRPPPVRFMDLIASRVQRNGAVRLISTTARHWSSVRSSSGTPGADMPAFLQDEIHQKLRSTSRWGSYVEQHVDPPCQHAQ